LLRFCFYVGFEYRNVIVRRVFARGFGPALLASLLLLGLVGCVSAPVQEMSDARQAVSAAEAAGAAALAPRSLQQARVLLASAQEALDRKRFSEARRDAREAKKHALQALHTAEEASREQGR